ncbi:FMN-binding negative transcriptional regulator [Qipengyuania zhejiangensis]|uniref:FMN-binding negative transcriptional regulator n=1 Tax=Qipengyuania zhejiangensis TaxID=3077782 RepID=UPI002D76EE7F|nr:FMN-binding negative transcriptional regulator [Qipengyuania sp. Z2]
MHPNPLFRSDDRARMEALVDRIGFGMVFMQTPDGPRVAHTPLLIGDGPTLRFHLARANALTRHLDGTTALITVNGPHGYVSPRWYDNRDTVPTWDYVAIEMEGQVRQLDQSDLDQLLYDLIAKQEGRLEGQAWSAQETSKPLWDGLLRGITGFEMEIREWRPTFKLSQKRTADERERIAQGHDQAGSAGLAAIMREGAV